MAMAPKKRGVGNEKASKYAKDAPWRKNTGDKAVPIISQGVMITVREGPNFHYAMSIIKHPDPIGMGLATEAFIEAAGPDCLVPGQPRPLRIGALQIWPLPFRPSLNFKALEPIGRELRTIGRLLEKAFDLMQAPFGER
eukprot:TRINITY_DN6503_c0_g1_i1.p2 TRINITY_DN6503_c0_g1~~TRINITY_DN6503_c0_g1_i1.p2  ORF type:complete len:139 (+),score=18.03 TRINITY_DN6503_c0_g1_i1:186-602(+)